jgi:hypothetical protein
VTERENEDLRADVAIEHEDEAPDAEVLARFLAQPFELGATLREETEHELHRRDGEWSAFASSVFREIDGAEAQVTRMSVEDQAIAKLKAEVDAELADVAPRLEATFRAGIEQRIWQAAKEQPTLGARISAWLDGLGRALLPHSRVGGFGLAAAMAAILVAIAVGGLFTSGDDPTDGADVSVDYVSFEGSVTVMQEGGSAVVWLAGDDDSAI